MLAGHMPLLWLNELLCPTLLDNYSYDVLISDIRSLKEHFTLK